MGRSGLSWGLFLALLGQQESRPPLGRPGYLPGIVATGGKRQVMFTWLRSELPKGFNQAFESAPGPETQNNHQGSLPDLQVAGASVCGAPAGKGFSFPGVTGDLDASLW